MPRQLQLPITLEVHLHLAQHRYQILVVALERLDRSNRMRCQDSRSLMQELPRQVVLVVLVLVVH